MESNRSSRKFVNIGSLLEKRQILPWNWNTEFLLSRTARKCQVKLASILDQRVYQGHVVLGFNHKGDCLISYCCQIDYPDHKYWLYWWWFDIKSELTLISKIEIFRDEVIEDDLYIVLVDDGINTFILGCRVGNGPESKPCYVTILSSLSPSQRHSRYTVHFKFELLLSLPSMFFAMNHSVPGYLILNTGISLVCVKYEIIPEGQTPKLVDDCLTYKQYTCVDVVYFTMPVTSNRIIVSGSPVAFKVFNQNTLMIPVHRDDEMPGERVALKQTIFDVDSWISRNLPLLLCGEDYKYHCLSDYKLEVIEIDLQSNITFILIAVVQVSSNTNLRCTKRVITLIGKWQMNSGCCKLLYLSQKERKQSNSVCTSNQWFQELASIGQVYIMTILPSSIIRGLSNKGIFTGNSLQAMPHPYLPVTLIL